MGCTCSVSTAEQLAEVAKHSGVADGPDDGRRAAGRLSVGGSDGATHGHPARRGCSVDSVPPMEPTELLTLADKVLSKDEDAFPDVDVCMLAATAVLQSHCRPDASRYSEETAERRLGLCQVSLATARWLASECGRTRHGREPRATTVKEPSANLFYAASYLQHLAALPCGLGGARFAVCAYATGPKGCNSPAGDAYWAAYSETRTMLERLWDSMQACASGSDDGRDDVTMHIVGVGESLHSLAACVGCTPSAILDANDGLDAPRPGDCIALPVRAPLRPRLHVLREGEALGGVAARYGATLGRLLRANPHIVRMDAARPGQLLLVPGLRTRSLLEEEAAAPRLRHILHSGESVHSVAAKHAISLEQLLAANPDLRDPLHAPRGTHLNIPVLE